MPDEIVIGETTKVSGRTHFSTFAPNTPMKDIREDVINVLSCYAAELPTTASTDNDETTYTYDVGILMVDASDTGHVKIATPGTDYMSPNTTTTLGTDNKIFLGTNGSIGGDGDGNFKNISVTGTATINELTASSANIANSTISHFDTGDGVFSSTTESTPVVTIKQSDTITGSILADGTATFRTLNVANLQVGGSAYKAYTVGQGAPGSSTDTTKLYINTNNSILYYYTGNNWAMLGAVFK